MSSVGTQTSDALSNICTTLAEHVRGNNPYQVTIRPLTPDTESSVDDNPYEVRQWSDTDDFSEDDADDERDDEDPPMWTTSLLMSPSDLASENDASHRWLMPGFTVPEHQQVASPPVTSDPFSPHKMRELGPVDWDIVQQEHNNIENEWNVRLGSLMSLVARNHAGVMTTVGYMPGSSSLLDNLKFVLDSGFNLPTQKELFVLYRDWILTDPTEVGIQQRKPLYLSMAVLNWSFNDVRTKITDGNIRRIVASFIWEFRAYCDLCRIPCKTRYDMSDSLEWADIP